MKVHLSKLVLLVTAGLACFILPTVAEGVPQLPVPSSSTTYSVSIDATTLTVVTSSTPASTSLSTAQTVEWLRFVYGLGTAFFTIALGWFVTQRVTAAWNVRQKHKEFDLEMARDFNELYGEFFAIWKLWAYAKGRRIRTESYPARRLQLLERACDAEGRMETIFVRLASERILLEREARLLGRFRQGYQCLRESIKDNKRLDWDSADDERYVAFKEMAQQVTHLILAGSRRKSSLVSRLRAGLTRRGNRSALRAITSNEWEGGWWQSTD